VSRFNVLASSILQKRDAVEIRGEVLKAEMKRKKTVSVRGNPKSIYTSTVLSFA
jgi:hypothetical protein